ncbi:MAG: PHP domain-containing protein [Mycobacterium leprae]
MKIIADLHTHTQYSNGKGTVLDNVTAAMARGLKVVAITDHGPGSARWVRARLSDFRDLRREVSSIDRRAEDMRVLAGVECNVISPRGDLDMPGEALSQLDIVLAGFHPFVRPANPRDWLHLSGPNVAALLSPSWGRRARVYNTGTLVAAVYMNEIDIITHPGFHVDIDTTELAKACAARDTALEINARHREMTAEYCRLAAKQGVRFVISSDAHAPADVGVFGNALAVAKAAGIEPEQVVNSDVGGLFAWLERRKWRRADASAWTDWAEQKPLDRTGEGAEEPEDEEERPPRGRGGRTERQESYWTDWSRQGKVH